MARGSKLTAEQRSELVLRWIRKEDSGAQLAREAGVSQTTLHRWREEFLNSGLDGLRGAGARNSQRSEVKRLQRQLLDREQIIGELTVANRILKKKLVG